MNFLKRLVHSKATPEETVVPDEYIKKYHEPSEKVQELLQRVPDTGKMLYQYIISDTPASQKSGSIGQSIYWREGLRPPALFS